ncbi:hypothetical protein CEUSTIGMA_g13879.t1 [Chlamydomonas eustigma]|uniref:Uncharacterized protein n=1 Tax=Chlamydomonas eustigma TaxID=1157962 RepID=A0A250XU13_9CHLO|nr:hypothetical protein CEUSTIGMA_g9287.t1 [Chlamydomonas eustigma]GAX86469.1 hypothetical protein CEUSTIGMA_g13879.t1 [Chlamydomonas eustigma]|eukprot:GAX81859.1 hypothetical protein CEUSTIGMA_g9287.t1 [Chlamydomonas eustigma]
MPSSSGRPVCATVSGVLPLYSNAMLGHAGSMQLRTIFGAPAKKVNMQIHTHDKYKVDNPQPKYEWMVGRFIMDRDGVIWHKQANRVRHRHSKTSGTLTRLKRLKPLSTGFAKKLKKIGFKRKYWQDPEPEMVPGFHSKTSGFRHRPRFDATPDLRDKVGDPALRPH